MKKMATILAVTIMVFSLSACGGESKPADNNAKTEPNQMVTIEQNSEEIQNESPENLEEGAEESTEESTEESIAPTTDVVTEFGINAEGIKTPEELEERIETHLSGLIESLDSRKERLFAEVDTYEKYCDTDAVANFYATIIDETNQMCIMLYEYAAYYARMIMDSDMSDKDKYDAIGGINDCLYEDACDEINDEIYEGIMEDMKEHFYEGIIDDAQGEAEYSKWYDIASDEYSQWYDTGTEIYSIFYDAAGDIYSFYYDMSGELYSGDSDRAEKLYAKFVQKIEKAKGNDITVNVSNASFDTTIKEATSIEELETIIEAHVSECIAALKNEWKELAAEIDTYDKYAENTDKVEAFHIRIENVSAEILAMICEYGVSYSELILQSDLSCNDMYDEYKGLKDCIYDDAFELVYDEIYENLLEEVKDYFYDGIIDDAKDYVKYSDWSDARGDTYEWWSDARGEVYDNWSDVRSKLYSFWSDVRSELYGNNLDEAKEEVLKFQKKIGK